MSARQSVVEHPAVEIARLRSCLDEERSMTQAPNRRRLLLGFAASPVLIAVADDWGWEAPDGGTAYPSAAGSWPPERVL